MGLNKKDIDLQRMGGPVQIGWGKVRIGGYDMGMDLCNEKGNRFWFDIFSWRKILVLAKRYGWNLGGTKKNPDWKDSEHFWNGNYLDNEGQIVTVEDALAIADALQLAFCDLDNSLEPEKWTEPSSEEITNDRLIKMLRQQLGSEDLEARVAAACKSPLEFLQGEAGMNARAFIHFCREGSFTIW